MLNNTSAPLDPSVLRGLPSQGYSNLGQIPGSMQGLQQLPGHYGVPGMRPPLGGGMPASGAPGPSILGLAGGHNIPPGSQGLQGRVGMQPGMAAGGPQQMRGSWGPVLGGNMGQGSGAGGGMMPPGSPARAMDRAAGQAGASGHESRASGPMQSRGAFLRGVPSGMTSMTNLGRIPVSNVASVAGQRLGSMPASAAFGLRGAPGQQDQQMMMGLQQQHKAGSQPGPMPGAGVLGPPPSSQPQFDHSDFPSLSFDGASASQGGDAPSRSIGLGGDYATMAMQALQDQKRGVVPDFSDTDFPALPGSLGGNSGSEVPDLGGARLAPGQRGAGMMGPGRGEEAAPGMAPGGAAYGQGPGSQQGGGGGPQGQMAGQGSNWGTVGGRGVGLGPGDNLRGQVGQGGKGVRQADMGQEERYGMAGLLSLIQMTDPDLATLALGTDLTTLGLNLNSHDHLYSTFASPWADSPLKLEDDFISPSCFLQISPPKLVPGALQKFRNETLLFIFYSMPGEEAQLLAADELSHRGWAFHKQQKMWLKRAPGTEPKSTTDQEESGSFVLFDPHAWKEVTRADLVVRYADLERPPGLPRPQGGVQQGAAAAKA